MSKGGHILTGATLGLLIATCRGSSGLTLAVVAGAAGTLPDLLECAWFGPNGERYSLIPHRTLTHWPLLWIAMALAGQLISLEIDRVAIGPMIAGLGLGALSHCILDMFTPTGIPMLNPFGSRRSMGPYLTRARRKYLYYTGAPSEWKILAPTTAIALTCLAICWRHGYLLG